MKSITPVGLPRLAAVVGERLLPTRRLGRDDAVFAQTPTAVRVTSIRGHRTHAGVLLRWRTAQETAVLGFNVYRLQNSRLVKLNRVLIPSVFGGTATGHAYSWLDRNTPRQRGGLRYRLQAVSLDGKRSWVGSASPAG